MEKEILLILAILMILMLIFSQGKISNFTFNQTVNQKIRIKLTDCDSYFSCYNLLSNYYTDNEIKQMGFKCENNVCSIEVEVSRDEI